MKLSFILKCHLLNILSSSCWEVPGALQSFRSESYMQLCSNFGCFPVTWAPTSPSPKSHPLSGSHTWPQLRLETWEQSFVLLHPWSTHSPHHQDLFNLWGVISRLSLLLLTSVPARVIAKTIQLISLYPVWILSIYLPQCSESDHVKGDSEHITPPSLNIRDSLPALRIQCNLILWLSKPFASLFY